MSDKAKLALDRPQDRSVAAYKAWVLGMMEALGVQDADDMDAAEWAEECRSFWAMTDAKQD